MAKHLTNYLTPLPKSQWYIGTRYVRTPEQWWDHLHRLRRQTGSFIMVSLALFVVTLLLEGANPGLSAWSLLSFYTLGFAVCILPWYVLTGRMIDKWFGDAYWVNDDSYGELPTGGIVLERTDVAQQDFNRRTNDGRY